MKLRSLKSLFLALCGAACFLGLNFSLCGPNGPSTPPKNPKLSDFLAIPQGQGWVEPAGAQVRAIGPDSMILYVDGQCGLFVGDSVSVGGKRVSTLDTGVYLQIPSVNAQDSLEATVFVFDYMTSGNAKTVYNRLTSPLLSSSIIVAIGNYNSATVVGEKTNAGILTGYGHFGKYFIIVAIKSLQFFPNASEVFSASLPKMNPFFTLYQSLIE
jgi:hypothetical protein